MEEKTAWKKCEVVKRIEENWENDQLNETEEKASIRQEILEAFDYSGEISDELLLEEIDRTIIRHSKIRMIDLKQKSELRKELFDSIRGLDLLEDLLNRDDITEVMVNGTEHIFIEEKGKLYEWNKHFESKERIEDIAQKIASFANRTVNEANPIMDARLKDGSRVCIVLPPVSLCNGPVISIRKFSKKAYSMEDLQAKGTITEEAAMYLKSLVCAGYNFFICGGTGSGKTTFLNALTEYIPEDERIITIEDSAELKIQRIKNLVRFEVRKQNAEGCSEISIRDLIKTSLRMRPDRIIVGEVRGPEVIDMLAAMNTGHDGSISTGHGNSVVDMLDRLETMVLLGTRIPLGAVRKQIASAIEIMIMLGRDKDGSRKVLEITEVCGSDKEEIVLNPLFVRDDDNERELKRTVNKMKRIGKLKRIGICLD